MREHRRLADGGQHHLVSGPCQRAVRDRVLARGFITGVPARGTTPSEKSQTTVSDWKTSPPSGARRPGSPITGRPAQVDRPASVVDLGVGDVEFLLRMGRRSGRHAIDNGVCLVLPASISQISPKRRTHEPIPGSPVACRVLVFYANPIQRLSRLGQHHFVILHLLVHQAGVGSALHGAHNLTQ